MRSALAVLLLVAILPLPIASAASWSVEATVAVTSATSADYTWKLTGITNTRLTLPIPDNSTFVDARDIDGRALPTSTTTTHIEVTSGARPFIVKFQLTGQRDGPFTIFPAQVSAASDSPVTVGVTLPAGWSLAGFRDNENDAPDPSGVFHKTGPSYVHFLALEPGHTQAGADPWLPEKGVRREGFANITATGVDWTLITTYDTDVWSRDWEVNVPAGATVLSASSPLGELTPVVAGESVKVHTPYPVGYGLGGRSFTVSMRLPMPDEHGGAFRLANLSIRAAEGDDIRITATLPPGAQYAGARTSGGAEAQPLLYTARGPLSVGLAYLPPAQNGHTQFQEGLFIIDTPASLSSAARATARNVTQLLPRVASFAADATDQGPFFVSYTEAPIFHWEEGFYSNGLNTISIRASTLANATDGAAHLVPVSILVHEATHGLIDRTLPDAPHNLSFLHEGLSRLAETLTERSFPDEVVVCRQELLSTKCDRHSARPSAADLQARYRSGEAFDVAWGATSVPESERGAMYDYSGLILHAYVQNAPPGALENALLHIKRTTFPGTSQDSAILMDILLSNAPGTQAQPLLYPGAQAASLPEDQFRYCLSALVAPPYSWETSRAPPGGCPSMEYGSREAPLPPAPAEQVTPPPAEAPPATPPPKIEPPQTTTPDGSTPTPPPSTSATPTGNGQPPDDIDLPPSTGTPAGTKTPVNVEIPGVGPALLLALVAVCAVVARRR